MSDSTPGWQADPTGKHDHRYWDGTQWTDNVSDAGVASTDPYVAEAAAAAPDATVAETPVVADAPAPPPAPIDPTVATPTPPAPDATAAWPTAPSPPPPYVPTNPVSPAGGGGGSKRGLLVGGGILAAVAIAVVAFLALGGDDDDKSNVQAQLASTLRREAGMSESDAECVAAFFVDDLGEDAFEGVDFNAEDPPPELQEAFVESGIKAVEECDLDESAFGTDGSTDSPSTTEGSSDGGDGTYGSDDELDALYDACEDGDYAACDELYNTSPAGSEYEEFADSCGDRNEPAGYCVDIYGEGDDSGGLTDGTELPDNYTDILADTYEESLGLSREQAECLADKLTRAIESGDITEEDAVAGFLDYLSDCNIDPEEIGAN